MPSYVQTFKVRGSSRFPLDMLRVEQCFPATIVDSLTLELYTCGDTDNFVTIKLQRITTRPMKLVSVKQWESKGWAFLKTSLTERKQ